MFTDATGEYPEGEEDLSRFICCFGSLVVFLLMLLFCLSGYSTQQNSYSVSHLLGTVTTQ